MTNQEIITLYNEGQLTNQELTIKLNVNYKDFALTSSEFLSRTEGFLPNHKCEKDFLYMPSGERTYFLSSGEDTGIRAIYLHNACVVDGTVAYGLPIKILQNGEIVKEFGDYYSRIQGLIRLQDGRLFLAWYQHERLTIDGYNGIMAHFAVYDGEWKELEPIFIYPNHFPTKATICQHPDGTIYWFSVHDGNHSIKMIKFDLDFNATCDFRWINITMPELEPYGEFPHIDSIATEDGIKIAYQRNYDVKVYSYSPYVKGTYINIINENKEILDVIPYYVERGDRFVLGKDFIAFRMIDYPTWNNLYVYDGELHSIGETNKFVLSGDDLVYELNGSILTFNG